MLVMMPGMGAADWRVGGVGLGARLGDDLGGLVGNVGDAGDAVQFEGDGAASVSVYFALADEADEEGLAGFDFDAHFLARFEAVEERAGGEDAHVAGLVAEFKEFGEDVGIHQVVVEVVVGDVAFEFVGEGFFSAARWRGGWRRGGL